MAIWADPVVIVDINTANIVTVRGDNPARVWTNIKQILPILTEEDFEQALPPPPVYQIWG